MSCPQSRPSIDLGASELLTSILTIEDKGQKNPFRSTPSRLQHSPSLPNIWFPPHSGPIPLEMSKVEGSRIQRPSAPPSPKPSPPKINSENELRRENRHVKYASIDPVTSNYSASKTHARRRTERDQPHWLLTPPLTPSSSIQTSSSLESRTSAPAHEDNDTPIEEGIVDPDPESTRILLLENVNQQLRIEDLNSAIFGSLLEHSSEKNVVDDWTKTPIIQLLRHDPLKGVNEKYLISKGEISVVFFDVRVAKIAKEILLDSNAWLHTRIGSKLADDGECRGLSARLITLEELSNTLGYSSFLDGVDGSFSISLKLVEQNVDVIDKTPADLATGISKMNLDVEIDAELGTISRGGFKIHVIQNIVKSFGAIRLFKFARQELNQEGCRLVYDIEYYDSREAATAFEDLSDKTMFGMKISVFRKPSFTHHLGSSQISTPFPNPSTAGESFVSLSTNQAVIPQSQCIPRFPHPRKDGRTRTSKSREYTSPHLTPHAVPADASSPPFFYTSTPSAEVSDNPSALCRDTSESTSNPTHHTHLHGQLWDGDHIHSPDGHGYVTEGICPYCPSRIHITYNAGFAHYAISPPTPSAVYYPAPVNTTQLPNVLNMGPITNQGAFTYDYAEPQQVQPVPNASLWGFDPAIAAIGPNTLIPLANTNVPSSTPFSLHDRDESRQTSGQVYQADHIQVSSQRMVQPSENSSRHPSGLRKALARIQTPEPSPIAYYTPLVKGETTAFTNLPSSGQNERNQLNIARIEEGLDTRTTVMIKNIPNKMNDADLTDYIGRVCPRRIDFLYLRMDFKNGCNVGYAFVNFISVQDLLRFAKERLGAKWNMFSSEKVLQMSYANYQGKEALVEKFRNSAIMEECESWRPRIFYSSGPKQGLLEPFPAATHYRRKERSSHNRGTLYPPNNSNGVLHNYSPNRRYNEQRIVRPYYSGSSEDNPSRFADK